MQKLNSCANDLVQWSNNDNKTQHEISKVKKKLEVEHTQVNASNVNHYITLKNKLDILLVQENLF